MGLCNIMYAIPKVKLLFKWISKTTNTCQQLCTATNLTRKRWVSSCNLLVCLDGVPQNQPRCQWHHTESAGSCAEMVDKKNANHILQLSLQWFIQHWLHVLLYKGLLVISLSVFQRKNVEILSSLWCPFIDENNFTSSITSFNFRLVSSKLVKCNTHIHYQKATIWPWATTL